MNNISQEQMFQLSNQHKQKDKLVKKILQEVKNEVVLNKLKKEIVKLIEQKISLSVISDFLNQNEKEEFVKNIVQIFKNDKNILNQYIQNFTANDCELVKYIIKLNMNNKITNELKQLNLQQKQTVGNSVIHKSKEVKMYISDEMAMILTQIKKV